MFYKDKFKKIRKSRKITQQAMSRLIGKSLKTLQRWEHGITEPSEYSINMLANVLSIPVNEISSLEENEHLHPLYYDHLSALDKTTIDFSTKTESEKQKIFIDLQRKVELQEWNIQQIKRKMNEYNDIMNMLDCIIYKKDRNLRYNYVNQKFLAYFNIPDPKLVIGGRNSDIWHKHNVWNELVELEQKVINEKVAVLKEVVPIPKALGAEGVGITTIKPIFDNKNNVMEVSVSVFDMTAEYANQELLEFIGTHIDVMADGVAITDNESNKYLYLNRAVSGICGYPLDLLYRKGHEFWRENIVYPEDKNEYMSVVKAMDNVQDDNKRSHRYRIIRADGMIVKIEVSFKLNKFNNCFYRVTTIRENH